MLLSPPELPRLGWVQPRLSCACLEHRHCQPARPSSVLLLIEVLQEPELSRRIWGHDAEFAVLRPDELGMLRSRVMPLLFPGLGECCVTSWRLPTDGWTWLMLSRASLLRRGHSWAPCHAEMTWAAHCSDGVGLIWWFGKPSVL